MAGLSHDLDLPAAGLDGERRRPRADRPGCDVDDREQGRVPRRHGQAVRARRVDRRPLLRRLHAHAVSGRLARRPLRAPTIIVLSLVWAGLATMLSGVITGLVAFIAIRVFTGLGEGAFYSNDRSLIAETTPVEKR